MRLSGKKRILMHFKRDLGHSHLKFQDTKQKEYQVLAK